MNNLHFETASYLDDSLNHNKQIFKGAPRGFFPLGDPLKKALFII